MFITHARPSASLVFKKSFFIVNNVNFVDGEYLPNSSVLSGSKEQSFDGIYHFQNSVIDKNVTLGCVIIIVNILTRSEIAQLLL